MERRGGALTNPSAIFNLLYFYVALSYIGQYGGLSSRWAEFNSP
jgi:hypothetical protein